MGVKDFFSLVLPNGKTIAEYGVAAALADFRDQYVAVDALGVLYPTMKVLMAHAQFTDADGVLTVHLMAALNKICEYRKAGLTQLWVFDSPAGNTRKAATNADRSAASAAAESAAGQFRITSAMVTDVIELMRMLGIAYMVAPAETEAEECAARLCSGPPASRFVAAVISGDTDVIMFGGVLLYHNKSTKTYTLYDPETIYVDFPQRSLVLAGVYMGTDFLPRTAGFGPKSAAKKAVAADTAGSVPPAVAETRDYFLGTAGIVVPPVVQTSADMESAVAALGRRGFDVDLVRKKLAVFAESAAVPKQPRKPAARKKAAAAASAASAATTTAAAAATSMH